MCVCVVLCSIGCGGKREGFIKYNYRNILNYVEGRREGSVFIFYGDEGACRGSEREGGWVVILLCVPEVR